MFSFAMRIWCLYLFNYFWVVMACLHLLPVILLDFTCDGKKKKDVLGNFMFRKL